MVKRKRRKFGSIDFVGGNLPWRARWSEKTVESKKGRRCDECFASEDEAVLHLDKVGAAIRRERPDALSRQIGRAGRLSEEVAIYRQARGISGVCKEYANAERNMIKRIASMYSLDYCHDINFDIVQRFAHELKGCRDGGYRQCAMIMTFLRHMKDKGVRIDDTAFKYGRKYFRIIDHPRNRETWSSQEVEAILRELTAPDLTDALPSGRGLGRSSKEKNDRQKEACYQRQKRAFFPIFMLLHRYALRPKETCLLRVRDWHPERKLLVSPPEITKNSTEKEIYVDEITACLINKGSLGRDRDDYLFIKETTHPRINETIRPRMTRRWHRPFMTRFFKLVLSRARVPGSLEGVGGRLYKSKHHACTQLAANYEGDLKLVMDVCGIKTYKAMLRYILIPPESKLKVAEGYNKENKSKTFQVNDIDSASPVPSSNSKDEKTIGFPIHSDEEESGDGQLSFCD